METIAIPESLTEAASRLGPEDEVGVWRIDPSRVASEEIEPGGPINLYVIGDDGMGDFLCLYPSKLEDGGPIPVVMWNPEVRQMTFLGNDFADFLEKESHRRLSFLLEHVEPLDSAVVAAARKGESPSLESIDEEKRVFSELICDLCRVADKLGLSESIFERACGQSGLPSFLREVDGGDDDAIASALEELGRSVSNGDGAAAFEMTAFHQVRQKEDDAVRSAYKLNQCSLFTWPDFSPPTLGRVVEMVKGNSAAIEARDRLDPLFGFLTSQASHKPDQRLNLAKDYLRKKNFAAAVREGENALRLSPTEPDAMRRPYDFLKEVFRMADRPREVAYVERMAAKLGSAG